MGEQKSLSVKHGNNAGFGGFTNWLKRSF